MLPTEQAAAADAAATAGSPEELKGHSISQQWLRVLGAALGRVVVILAVTMMGWASAPALLGWQPTTVVSGSMEPTISVGDVVVSRPMGAENLTPGRVVLVDDPDHADRLRLHRIAAVNPDGSLVLRGDANAANDSSSVWPSAVHGVGYLRIPAVGLPIVWIGRGQWVLVIIGVAVLAAALAMTRLDRHFARPGRKVARSGGPKSGSRRRADWKAWLGQARRASSLVLFLAAAAGLAGAAVMTAPMAHAAFASTSSTQASTLSSRTFFSCTAAALADSPSLFYGFNDSPKPATAVTDSSGTGNDGTFRMTASLGTAVPCAGDGGSSADLAGLRYIATTTGSTGPTAFSYEMWFKTTSILGGKLAGFQDSKNNVTGVNDRNLYMRVDGKLVFGVAPGGTMHTIVSPAAYNDGAWHHAAVSLSSAGMNLYVDGASVAASAAVTTARSGYTGYWRFGNGDLTGWPGAGLTAFDGQVDNIAVYDTTALTPAQVLAHFQAAAP
ncbi:LamG-like jellyroll fold domain-containing protein [Arthrobacter celericrescens]|uniref:LamG-like jellyroll fold domain-containing protein n=1 Tax=Arthrobacter celericrescens TaxID=2320851 RepID=UPI000EA03A33|nr:LamG-like jellyroll fold domain-containing protein [Arthrobacter celericrescens]